MSVPAFGPHSSGPDAARSVSDIAELLDVVYENARQSAASPVSTTQLRLMFLVDRQPGIRMRALAQLLAAAGPSVTRLCDRLEAAGFLRRHRCADDGREVTLRLTPAGERHLARIRETRERTLAQALDTMTPDSRQALASGLAALRRGITATSGFPK
ncbi:MarR family winged helix-turn-helix transcriptional regulator [Streptomyces antarcticus]|uniref:MarR family winged helix-turn-helix transcriptional regulator n=1 Tax=Streptomyces antarcticus TaxID=2996458 RepID=UPI0022719EBC|nr:MULTISPECIES: MarR family transcriptional regulator [unclassified Streptomyces]MCY0945490.1 MarR family transcriptional regulator [Streptomyces sp. H34-AA3]MCY0953115.1 MarR family transcriptional regulator [Streptomyces sp. H27-S2]MCZ4083611.1 MarR family transcriptional regulator [Streptomyces sp. H34-S5]